MASWKPNGNQSHPMQIRNPATVNISPMASTGSPEGSDQLYREFLRESTSDNTSDEDSLSPLETWGTLKKKYAQAKEIIKIQQIEIEALRNIQHAKNASGGPAKHGQGQCGRSSSSARAHAPNSKNPYQDEVVSVWTQMQESVAQKCKEVEVLNEKIGRHLKTIELFKKEVCYFRVECERKAGVIATMTNQIQFLNETMSRKDQMIQELKHTLTSEKSKNRWRLSRASLTEVQLTQVYQQVGYMQREHERLLRMVHGREEVIVRQDIQLTHYWRYLSKNGERIAFMEKQLRERDFEFQTRMKDMSKILGERNAEIRQLVHMLKMKEKTIKDDEAFKLKKPSVTNSEASEEYEQIINAILDENDQTPEPNKGHCPQ